MEIIGLSIFIVSIVLVILRKLDKSLNAVDKKEKVPVNNKKIIKDIYSEVESNIQAKRDSDEQLAAKIEDLVTTNAVHLISVHYKKLAECIVKDAVHYSRFGYELHYRYIDNCWQVNYSANNEFNNYLKSVGVELSDLFRMSGLIEMEPPQRHVYSEKFYKIFNQLNDYLSLYNLKFLPIIPYPEFSIKSWYIKNAD